MIYKNFFRDRCKHVALHDEEGKQLTEFQPIGPHLTFNFDGPARIVWVHFYDDAFELQMRTKLDHVYFNSGDILNIEW